MQPEKCIIANLFHIINYMGLYSKPHFAPYIREGGLIINP